MSDENAPSVWPSEGQPEISPKTAPTIGGDAPQKFSHRFRKGQSGNPGGRPRAEREVRELAQAYGPRAIRRLAGLMRSTNERVAVAAASALLDRGYGKPFQAVTGKDGTPLFPVIAAGTVATSAEERAQIYRALIGDPAFDTSSISFAPPATLPPVQVPVAAPAADEPDAPVVSASAKLWMRLGEMEE
jgi:hypothetical protein